MTQSNALQFFDVEGSHWRFGHDADGTPWVVGTDVAHSFEYLSAKDAARLLDEDEKGRRIVPTPGATNVRATPYTVNPIPYTHLMSQPQRTADNLIATLLGALTSIDDPSERARIAGAALTSVPGLQRALREIRQGAVQELRDAGASHADVAAVLGVSRARAAQIAEGKTSRARTAEDAQTAG